MRGGFSGKLLLVDLERESSEELEYPRETALELLGGFGANNRLFAERSTPGTDPLSPGNPVVFGAGPLVGTLVPGASRVMATTRLPLTGSVGSCSGSMGFGANLKWAGFDHLLLVGAARRPVTLVVEDSRVEFVSAEPLRGSGTREVTGILWDAYPGHSVLTVGPAGERLVHSALAMIDCSATIGRGGLGAVLGSKNVKAIAVKGSRGVEIADPPRLESLARGLFERLERWPMAEAARELGMIGAWAMYARQLVPFGSSEEDVQAATERFGPGAYLQMKKKRISCPSCFLPDKDVLRPPGDGGDVYSTSFLNAAIIGCAFQLADAEEAVSLLALLDDLGLDFMTLLNQAAFLLELASRGLIDEKDTEGIPFEPRGAMLRELAGMVAGRHGALGEALAEGWRGAIEYFGEGSRAFTMLVRGQDCLYDPRVTGLGTMEFEQVVSPRGPTSASAGSATYVPGAEPDRLRSLTERMGAGPEALDRIFARGGMNVGRLTRYSEDWFSLFSSLGICNRYQVNRFYNAPLVRDLLSAVTGLELEASEMMRRAAAGFELYRELAAREGLGREADIFPEAWFNEEPLWGRGGRIKDYFGRELSREDVLGFLEDYYDERAR